MQIIELNVALRDELGKNKVKQLKKDNLIPSIIYGEGLEPLPIKLDKKSLTNIYKSKSGTNTIIKMTIDNNKTENVISHDIRYNAISGEVEHVDFLKIDMNKKISTNVHIKYTGTPVGVKMGGLILHNMNELAIECLPSDIPETIEIDVTNINLGEAFRVGNLNLGDKLTCLNPKEEIIAHVEAPRGASIEESTTEETATAAN